MAIMPMIWSIEIPAKLFQYHKQLATHHFSMIQPFSVLVAHVKLESIVIFQIIFRFSFVGRVPGDTTSEIANPIMPSTLVSWYRANGSGILGAMNPVLSQSQVNGICSNSFECEHDYIIRVNRMTSAATASAISSFQEKNVAFGKCLICKI